MEPENDYLSLSDINEDSLPHIFNINSLKTPVFSCKLKKNNQSIVVKKMNKNFNFGRDAMLCYYVKSMLGMNVPKMARLININFEFNKSTLKLVKSIDYYPAFISDDISQYNDIKDLRMTHCIVRQYISFNSYEGRRSLCEIIIFRALMGVTDTNMSNIIIDDNNKLYSIDENFVGTYSAEKVLNSSGVQTILRKIGKNNNNKIEWPSWITDKNYFKKIVSFNNERFQGYCKIREDNWDYLYNLYKLERIKY